MRKVGLLVACALLLATNAFVLVGVARNRSGDPEAEIVLTERELALPWQEGDESTGLPLRLEWGQWSGWRDETTAWFDAAKLAAVGFDVSFPAGLAGAPEFYRRQLSRKVLIVFEFEGHAWQDRLVALGANVDEVASDMAHQKATASDLAAARQALERAKVSDSRLLPVDAGTDALVLRALHPDRRRDLILQASVLAEVNQLRDATRPGRDGIPGSSPRVHGWIERILTDQIDVPPSWRETLSAAGSRARGEEDRPRYAATVRIGSRLEPWIVDLRPLPLREGGP